MFYHSRALKEIVGRLSLTSNTDTIRVVSCDIKAGFIGLATSKFGHSAE